MIFGYPDVASRPQTPARCYSEGGYQREAALTKRGTGRREVAQTCHGALLVVFTVIIITQRPIINR